MQLQTTDEKTNFQIIKVLFFSVFLMISFLILFVSPSLDYVCKKSFAFSNIILLLFDILILSAIYILWLKFKNSLTIKIEKYGTLFIVIASALLFVIQIIVSHNIFFATGWDPGDNVIPAAKLVAAGMPVSDFYDYFSVYPNNIAVVWIFSIIFKVSKLFGDFGLISIVMVNCFISSLTGFLTYKCVEKLLNKQWALFSWIFYFLLIGTSPWVLITYTDAIALFLPILIFFVYTRNWNAKYHLFKCLLIGILSFMGYRIRPQVIIILIAIVIIEIWKVFSLSKNIDKKKTLFVAIVLTFTFLLSNFLYSMIVKQTGLIINKESTFGMSHFVMMGLNNERGGLYADDDVIYSYSFATQSERKQANITVIKERLQNFGFNGYMEFLERKTLVNYADGTFAWSIEGNFYAQTYADTNYWLSPTLKSYFYIYGSNYIITSTVQQAVWIGVIISMLGLIFTDKKRLKKETAVLMLSLLGLTAFVLIFEARARYLYIYAPFYITLGILGLKNIVFVISEFKEKMTVKNKVKN